jgi:hypothetical protein
MPPSVVSAVALAESWIYWVLSNDATLAGLVGTQIYTGVAPEGATYPLLVVQYLSALDTVAMDNERVLTNIRYGVHCADRVGSILHLDAIAARVDQVLHGQSNYTFPTGAYMLNCQREQPISTFGEVAGVQTRELVNIYALVIQEVSDT